jgi:anthranilate phosphoribosyltransferase
MPDALSQAIERILSAQDLSPDAMYAAVSQIMEGAAGEVSIAAFLTALRMKGETENELVGAARAMRERSTKIPTTRSGLLDTCGTGGDSLHTFNISTAAALAAAACGVPVAKHGNRSATSKSGSADVLEALGVRLDLSPEQVARCVDDVGIGFCFAPLLHAAMKHVAPVRKQLGFRTIFNFLGPLTNPAGAEYQLIGASRPDTAEKLARALAKLGTTRAFVVCGAGELDEVSLWGKTSAFEVAGGNVSRAEWSAKSFGLPECRVGDLQVSSPQESAQIIQKVFAGERGPARDMVLANTSAALLTARKTADLLSGVAQASAVIDSGRAAELVGRLAEWTNS